MEYPLNQFATDYSLWDELVEFLKHPTSEWAKINIDASLTSFRLTAAWVTNSTGEVVYGAKEPGVEKMPEYPDTDGTLLAYLKRNHFVSAYHRQKDTVYALRAAPIQPSADIQRSSSPLGWLIAVVEIDPAFLQRIGTLNSTKASLLHSVDASLHSQTSPALVRELRDPAGSLIAVLHLDFASPEQTEESNKSEMALFVIVTLTLITTVILCLHYWVLRPFRSISESLVTGKPELLQPVLTNRTEIGHIARLVRIHFAHHKALSETIEDRAQLARDLHDGVIQSIYAAGMGVAAAQALFKTDPEAAAQQLEQIRKSLNDTIREARGFISGLEARIADDRPFGLAVETLLESMSWIRRTKASVQIDEITARQLPQSTRAQALQMIREAVSNSLRHGKANNLVITIQKKADTIILSVRDDGLGFDTSQKHSSGHGLSNLVERARAAGGSATIESTPGKGTCVSVAFSSAKAALHEH
ncbi:MAG: CHASE4 domain-containing protein [Nibricoccus sp.]